MKSSLFTWCVFIPLTILIAIIEIWWESKTGYSFPNILNFVIGLCLFGGIWLIADKYFNV